MAPVPAPRAGHRRPTCRSTGTVRSRTERCSFVSFLDMLQDVGDWCPLVLPDREGRQFAPAFVRQLRLVDVAQRESVALAGGDVIAHRAMEAEDRFQDSPLLVAGAPDEVIIVYPCRAIFPTRRVGSRP